MLSKVFFMLSFLCCIAQNQTSSISTQTQVANDSYFRLNRTSMDIAARLFYMHEIIRFAQNLPKNFNKILKLIL